MRPFSKNLSTTLDYKVTTYYCFVCELDSSDRNCHCTKEERPKPEWLIPGYKNVKTFGELSNRTFNTIAYKTWGYEILNIVEAKHKDSSEVDRKYLLVHKYGNSWRIRKLYSFN